MMDPAIAAMLNQEDSILQTKCAPILAKCIKQAERHWSQGHDAWQESERRNRAFRVPDKDDQKTRKGSLTQGVEKIVLPVSYASTQSRLAYLMSTILDRNPIIPVEGLGPDDVMSAINMEAALDYQAEFMMTPLLLAYFQWMFDAETYGIGILKNTYTIREWVDLVRSFNPILGPMGEQMGLDDQLEEQETVAYEGNELLNIKPFNFLPDPNRSMGEFQKGDHCTFKFEVSGTELSFKAAEGIYAGVDFIPMRTKETPDFAAESDLARTVDMGEMDFTHEERDEYGKPYTTLHEHYKWCTPQQLVAMGFPERFVSATSNTPRMWIFSLANKQRLIRAEIFHSPARRFPAEVIEPNYNIHSPRNFGTIETIRGLDYHMSWLYNARMLNVRKTLNNEYVVDPSMIEMDDLLQSEAGRMIRLNRQAQQAGMIDKAVYPLPVVDVTSGYANDAKVTSEWIEMVTGANRLVMGLANSGRRAATEVQGQLRLAAGRLDTGARLYVEQGFKKIAYQKSRNTQVFMEQSLNLRLKEEYARSIGAASVEITPRMLQGNFKFPFLDGGIPTDRYFEANVWKELLTIGIQSGTAVQLLQQLNWLKVAERFFQTMGVKNLRDYALPASQMPQVQAMPDQQVEQQAQQGNLVPSDGFAMGPNGGGNGNGAMH